MKLFKENKFDVWWNSLPTHTQEYLRHQPIWKHEEMVGGMIAAFVVGILIGLCF